MHTVCTTDFPCDSCSRLVGNVRITTGLLTGHVALYRRLTIIKIRTDPMFYKCGEEEETSYHLLGRCSAMMMARYSIFGSHLMDTTEL